MECCLGAGKVSSRVPEAAVDPFSPKPLPQGSSGNPFEPTPAVLALGLPADEAGGPPQTSPKPLVSSSFFSAAGKPKSPFEKASFEAKGLDSAEGGGELEVSTDVLRTGPCLEATTEVLAGATPPPPPPPHPELPLSKSWLALAGGGDAGMMGAVRVLGEEGGLSHPRFPTASKLWLTLAGGAEGMVVGEVGASEVAGIPLPPHPPPPISKA